MKKNLLTYLVAKKEMKNKNEFTYVIYWVGGGMLLQLRLFYRLR